MSTQKALISDPKKARRSLASVLAEVFICKAFGWKIEFLSGGYDSYSVEELVKIAKLVYRISGEKPWLNIGTLSKEELELFKPYVVGVCGAVEIVDPALHDSVCPSKPISDIEEVFSACDALGLKKAMTMIVGLGESKAHLEKLKAFITKHSIDRITFYRLKPQKGTPYTKGPSSEEYVWWVKETRLSFPDIDIVVGSWLDHLDEISLLLEAGADSVTKFPSIKMFGSKEAEKIESEASVAGRIFEGTLTRFRNVDWDSEIETADIDPELSSRIKEKLFSYLASMQKSLKKD